MKISKIFLSIPASASSGFSDNIWQSIFLDTLAKLKYNVYYYPYHQAKSDLNSTKITKELISEQIFKKFITEHNKQKFDLFLSYYHTEYISSDLFENIRKHVYCVNYTTNFHQINIYEPLLDKADLTIYASIEGKSYFEEKGINSYYMPFGGLNLESKFITKKDGSINFIGTAYGNRPYYLWRCLQNNLDINIYGHDWKKSFYQKSILRLALIGKNVFFKKNAINESNKLLRELILLELQEKYSRHLNGNVSDNDYFELLRNSSIIINFPESRYKHDFTEPKVLIGANLRDFEVTMCGSMLFTQYSEEIINYFKDDTEIVTFKNEFEMIDKLKFYTKNESLCNRIAQKGHIRCKDEHTWKSRFSNLMKFIENQ